MQKAWLKCFAWVLLRQNLRKEFDCKWFIWEKIPGSTERIWKWDMKKRKPTFLIDIKAQVITVNNWALSCQGPSEKEHQNFFLRSKEAGILQILSLICWWCPAGQGEEQSVYRGTFK